MHIKLEKAFEQGQSYKAEHIFSTYLNFNEIICSFVYFPSNGLQQVSVYLCIAVMCRVEMTRRGWAGNKSFAANVRMR